VCRRVVWNKHQAIWEKKIVAYFKAFSEQSSVRTEKISKTSFRIVDALSENGIQKFRNACWKGGRLSELIRYVLDQFVSNRVRISRTGKPDHESLDYAFKLKTMRDLIVPHTTVWVSLSRLMLTPQSFSHSLNWIHVWIPLRRKYKRQPSKFEPQFPFH
jgi:hypothetical protein